MARIKITVGMGTGWATMTLPFLLCELSNGISEVCAIQWGICALWMTERATARMIGKIGSVSGFSKDSPFLLHFITGWLFGLLLMFLIIGRVIENIPSKGKDALSTAQRGCRGCNVSYSCSRTLCFHSWMSIQSDSRLWSCETTLSMNSC